MQQPIVVLVGHVCVDNNTIDGVKVESWGSSTMYIAHCLLRDFGIKARIISSYGEDFVRYTKEFDFLVPPGAHKTLRCENVVNDGVRVQYFRNLESGAPAALDDRMKQLLSKADILITATLLADYPVEYIASIVELLPPKCLKVLLPQGYMRHINAEGRVEKREFAEAEALLPYFDAMVASDEDHDDALRWAEQWASYRRRRGSRESRIRIVITQADKGATLFYKGKRQQIPTTPIPFNEIKNPVGSGDTFGAYLAMGLYDGLDAAGAVREANKATARVLKTC